jgi:RNA polymerase sigma factor (sigma-70 family)
MMSQHESEQSAAKQKGPGMTLEEAFTLYERELFGTLRYLLGNEEDARDAIQEAFVRCWRRREGLSEIQNLKAWIFRVATNIGRDVRKSAWKRRSVPMPEDESIIPSKQTLPESQVERREEIALLQTEIEKLRESERQVFLLRQNGQLTYEEIAETLDIPVGTVKTRMRLALQRLQSALASTEPK